MGKKDKSEISGSGTMRMTREQFEKARENQSEVQMRGAGGKDFELKAEYTGTVTLIKRGESNGAKTSGAPNYRVEVTIDSPADYEGRKANVFTIAHELTSTAYMKFLNAVLGIAPEDMDTDSEGYVVIPRPSQAECDRAMGKSVTVVVTGSSPRKDKPEYTNFDFDFVVTGAKKAKAKKDKKRNAE